MNNVTRKQIKNLISELNTISDKLENILDDEQDKFDNLSEGLQYSLMGETMEDAIDCMNDGLNSINEAIINLKNI